ncbi:MAG: hypothetical protein MZV63_06535 [Marinilabiliales bacterium]|nr:hypothetical protein [Marinilabiliales bacterium]
MDTVGGEGRRRLGRSTAPRPSSPTGGIADVYIVLCQTDPAAQPATAGSRSSWFPRAPRARRRRGRRRRWGSG